MFDGRLKVTICGAKDLQHTNLTVRTKSMKVVGIFEPAVSQKYFKQIQKF